MNSNKGITLTVLVITISVLLILASVTTYVGFDVIKNSKEQKFISELTQVSNAVYTYNNYYESLELKEDNIIYNGIVYNYKLENKEDYNKLNLQYIDDIIYVNFKLGKVYSKNGFNGKHTLEEFGIETYNPIQVKD